jgi:hypothetical protein
MQPNPKLPINQGTAILPALPPWLAYTQGDIWHVKPVNGLDTNSGKSPRMAFKTLAAALDAATADQNDIVLMYAEGNSGAAVSDFQSTMLDWNKDCVHLIGVNSGVSISPRSRISAISTWTSADPAMKVSANSCYFANLQIIMDATDATPLGALSVTGSRCRFDNCHVYGIVYAANDIVGAYSLLLSGAEEVEFHGCQFGSDRIAKGAQANSVIKCAATAKNVVFDGCLFRMATTHGTNHLFLRAAAGSLDGSIAFVRGCCGINSQSRNIGASELTYAFSVAADAGGDVFVSPDSVFQATDLNASDAGNVYGATTASGIAVPVTK